MKRDDGFFLLNIVEALYDIIEYTNVSPEIFLKDDTDKSLKIIFAPFCQL